MTQQKLLKTIKENVNNKNVILEGTEGVGKTYFGESLSKELGYYYYKSSAETIDKKKEYDQFLKKDKTLADRIGVISSYVLTGLSYLKFSSLNFRSLFSSTPDVWLSLSTDTYFILLISKPSVLLERLIIRGDSYFNLESLSVDDWNSLTFKNKLLRIKEIQNNLETDKEQRIYLEFLHNIQTHINIQADLNKWVHVVDNSDFNNPELITYSEAVDRVAVEEVWNIKTTGNKITSFDVKERNNCVIVKLYDKEKKLLFRVEVNHIKSWKLINNVIHVYPSSQSTSEYHNYHYDISIKNLPGKYFDKIQSKNLKSTKI